METEVITAPEPPVEAKMFLRKTLSAEEEDEIEVASSEEEDDENMSAAAAEVEEDLQHDFGEQQKCFKEKRKNVEKVKSTIYDKKYTTEVKEKAEYYNAAMQCLRNK